MHALLVLDLRSIECYHRELSKLEEHLERQAKQHDPASLSVLRTIPGVGRILALTMLYEIGDNKAKALSALTHKLGRAAYFMLKHQRVFDEQRFLKG